MKRYPSLLLIIAIGFAAAATLCFLYCQKDRIAPHQPVFFPTGRFMMVDDDLSPRQYGLLTGGEVNSEWLYWHDNGLLAAREFYDNGRILQGLYFDNAGLLVSQVEDGTGIAVGHDRYGVSNVRSYKSGVLSGPYVGYHSEGVHMGIGEYADGKRHGHHLSFRQSGQLERVSFYQHGMMQGDVQYSPDGTVIFEIVSPPPMLTGARIYGFHWDDGLHRVEYWLENGDVGWRLNWRLVR